MSSYNKKMLVSWLVLSLSFCGNINGMKKMPLLSGITCGSRTPSTYMNLEHLDPKKMSELYWQTESLLAFMFQFQKYENDELEEVLRQIVNYDMRLETWVKVCVNGEYQAYKKNCLIGKFKNISFKEKNDNHVIIVFKDGDLIDSAEIEGTREGKYECWNFGVLGIAPNSTGSESYFLANENYDYLRDIINKEVSVGNVKSKWEWRMVFEARSVLNMLVPLAKQSAKEIKSNLEKISGYAIVSAVFGGGEYSGSEEVWEEAFKSASVTIDDDDHITIIFKDGASISYVKVEGVRHNEVWHFKLLNITQGEDM